MRTILVFVLLVGSLFAAQTSWAQLQKDPEVYPPSPAPFERVNLRLTVDDCVFNPDSVRVSSEAAITDVSITWRACLVAGPTKVVDVQIGAFAAGKHSATLTINPPNSQMGAPSRVYRLDFTVLPLVEIAVYPPPPKPYTDYSGTWFNAQESGWGLSIHQEATHQMFVAWFGYDTLGQAQWYSVQNGQWNDFRTWCGTVYRTSGPQFFGVVYDSTLLSIQSVGSACISFDQTPSTTGVAALSYTVNGVGGAKTMRKLTM